MTNKTQSNVASTSGTKSAGMPKVGDKYECEKCGMAVEVTSDCGCHDPNHVQFQCCGQAMTKA